MNGLDNRPVRHKTDDGIKALLNLAVLAYWGVSVTKRRLKVNEYNKLRWDEIMRIASPQVVVTAMVQTEDGHEFPSPEHPGRGQAQCHLRTAARQSQTARQDKIRRVPNFSSKKRQHLKVRKLRNYSLQCGLKEAR